MTEDEIRNLSAGIEMDALIAEKVMGWHSYPKDYYWYDKDNKPMRLRWFDSESLADEFEPSTDIAAAWEVVEKLESDNLCMTILNDGSRWSVFIYNEHKVTMAYANADTAPLAICRAALLTTI